MNETKFTPGPWSTSLLTKYERTEITGGKLKLITSTDGGLIGFLNQWQDLPEDAEEATANAHLIAAAPEMYEALELCAFHIHKLTTARGKADYSVIRAALAKARGEA